MKKRLWPCLLFLSMGLALLIGLGQFDIVVGGGHPDTLALKLMRAWIYRTNPGGTPLDPQDLGGWLGAHAETAQPFEFYRLEDPLRPTAVRRTIVIQPIGAMTDDQRQVVNLMVLYAQAFFQLPVRLAQPLNLTPADPRSTWGADKVDADDLLDHVLVPRVPPDALACLGVTMADLKSHGTNFVFGLGSYRQRVGIYSLCRYTSAFWHRPPTPDERKTLLRRACSVLTHETGHMLGLSHCVFYRCNMNGSDSLWELDSHPLDYCPLCERKLQWNIGFDSKARADALHEFRQELGI